MDTTTKPKLTARDYEMAHASQSACNLSGIVLSLARLMPAISAETCGTNDRNQHPIVRLYAEQIHFLASGCSYSDAYRICEERAEGKVPQ